ncbi:hypothetical protein [Roseobacter sp. CCS2]|uniref:hypothetical protein n=1 Tax=Roseobacter sp. CCS2 TaxID=391593 RepID=UPI0000F403C5|nr:hypothetical protein [Roseobacter sp. CCS2]EBA13604.1 hypothetical protein RCCS2_06944 [Roseobacter sp. CCS2]
MKIWLRMLTAVILGAAGILTLMSHDAAVVATRPESPLIPTDETTPETIALRGCIEGIDPLSGNDLSTLKQIAACDTYVLVAEDKINATYSRALYLFHQGITDAHRDQAYRDFTYVIDAKEDAAPAYANRALLNLRQRNAPFEALADISAAIELRNETPRANYYERRAAIFLILAWQTKDEAQVYQALEDIETVRTLDPGSHAIKQLETTASDVLRQLHLDAGQDIQEG